MALVRLSSIEEGAGTTEFHIQAGTDGDIGVTGTAHFSRHRLCVKVGSFQGAGTAEVDLHLVVAVAVNEGV